MNWAWGKPKHLMAGLLVILLAAGMVWSAPATAKTEALTKRYLKLLQSGTNSQRTDAAWMLGKSYMVRTPEVIPALIRALQDPYPAVRANAAAALSKIGPPAKEAIPELKATLNDPHGRAVINAAIALRQMGVSTKELMPAVRKVLDYEDGVHRVAAISLLRSWGISDREMTPHLAKVLTDPNQKARERAIREFIEIRCIEGPALDRVIAALGDPYEKVRLFAAIVLRQNCGRPVKQAVAPLILLLDDSSAEVQGSAVNALGEYKALAQPAVPKLLAILKSGAEDNLVKSTCRALGAIGGPQKKEIGLALVGILSSHPQWPVRMDAGFGLRYLQSKDPAVVAALKKASQEDEVKGVRTAAMLALKNVGINVTAK